MLSIFLGVVGPWQIVIIVALILLLFGGKKIPELMRGLGSGIREFKDAAKDPNEKKPENTEKSEIETSKWFHITQIQ